MSGKAIKFCLGNVEKSVDRLVVTCSEIENEFHFILKCPKYKYLRSIYVKR